ncbi:hypothetical protein [Archaeoglobus neptunius]|uniref:hypothetical protein n=1 Tax=Archaeoglobus neptunius TaxID=2798580 RepID=UPI001926F9F5|nr:hypothetical protein [Archaeoglobus neptunius]
MDVIANIFNKADDGDRIMISFPDVLSFYTVGKWLYEQFGEPFWVLWTDAAVERINYLGRKFDFPVYGDAVAIGARKECSLLNMVGKFEIFEDLGQIMRMMSFDNRIIISFGVNFLELFGYDISKAVEMIIEHESGILCTCTIGELSEKLLPFHDTVIEIKKGEESYLSYHSYVARLKFAVDGGVAEVSDVFFLKE